MSFLKKFTEIISPNTEIPIIQEEFNKEIILPEAHPSVFEDVNFNAKNLIENKKTLDELMLERKGVFKTNLGKTFDISSLVSPGKHKLTGDDGDKKLSGSNTKSMFKNLYGETLLTFLYFSEDNVNNIQKLLKMLVFKEMNMVIDDQSNRELLVIMRSIFLEYSRHPKLIDGSMSEQEKKILLKQYTDEVARLNELVVKELVPKICSQLSQYLFYLRDAGSPRYIMELPKSDSTTGQRKYRSITNVLTGKF